MSLHLRRHVVWVLTGVVGLVCRCVLDLSIAITTAMICGHEATLRYVPRLRLISRLKHALFMWHSQTPIRANKLLAVNKRTITRAYYIVEWAFLLEFRAFAERDSLRISSMLRLRLSSYSWYRLSASTAVIPLLRNASTLLSNRRTSYLMAYNNDEFLPWVELSSFKTKAPANGQCIIGQFARLLME